MSRSEEKHEEKPATPPPAEDADLPAHYALAHHLPDDLPPPDEIPSQEEAKFKPEPLQAPPQRLFVNKLDPYDEENFAALFLKDEPLPITLPEVKTEPKVEAHEPSADLVDAIRQYENMLQHEQDAMQANGAAVKAELGVVNNHVKPEPDAEAFQASDQLIAAIAAHEAQLARERSQVKAEEEQAGTQQSAASVGPGYTVKQESEAESLPPRRECLDILLVVLEEGETGTR
ncbi:hypothetical protein EIP86_001061 [Pleurotus ostreatoroseus]|nr:hypothetical protein EIP86_001061 [Pleurotus ostreatoroseus]